MRHRSRYILAAIALATVGIYMGMRGAAQNAPTAVVEESTACPSPTTEADNGDCVLTEDVTIGRTLALDSSTTLDCQGHTLSAFAPGSGSTADTYRASVPELAILLNGTIGTTVKNCTLEGFDFGVVIAKSKIPEALYDDASALAPRRNRLLSNTITARAGGVEVFGADNNEIRGNTIRYTSGGSKGAIHLFRDSDKNLVTGNTIRGATTPHEFVRYAPGFPLSFPCIECAVLSSNPISFPLVNLIVDGALVAQFPNAADQVNNDNVVEGNDIALFGSSAGKFHRGITLAGRTASMVVRNNTMTGGRVGIYGSGYSENAQAILPTTCTLDSTRFCATTDDCFIPGVDVESKGICQGTRSVVVDGRVPNALIENNTMNGPFAESAMDMWAENDLIIQNNRINGTGSENGIRMSGDTSLGAIVRRNVISGARVALRLDGGTGVASAPHGAKISLNDFLGSIFRAIEVGPTDPAFGAPGAVELSAGHCAQDASISCSNDKVCVDRGRGLCVEMRGNYWDRTCADSEGFREFGQTSADSPKKSIVDSHPYGEPVAMTATESLPATCK